MIRISLQTIFALILLLPGVAGAQDTTSIDVEQAEALENYIEGINHFENEEYELALDKLTVAHLKNSENPGINYALSDVYLATGDFSNAEYYAKIAAKLDPDNKWYRIHLADIYTQSGQNRQAIDALESVLKKHPGDTDLLYRLSGIYTEMGELEKSNEALARILEMRGPIFEIHLRRFQNYNALGENEKALTELEKMRELKPDHLTTLQAMSRFYLELDQEEKAREVLNDAFARNPNDIGTLLLLAEIYIKNDEWEKTGNTFIRMIENKVISPTQKMELVRFMLMKVQNNSENEVISNQAGRVVKAMTDNEPDYGPAHLLAAEFYLQKRMEEKALQSLEKAIGINPDLPEAWTQRIQILFSQGRYQEIIDLSGEAAEYAPDNAFIQFFTGAAYMFLDEFGKAEEWLQQASFSPSRRNFRSVVFGTLGDVKQQLEKWQETVEAYERAIRLDSENYTELNNYAYYLTKRNENLDKALEMAQEAVESDPRNASFLDTLGWVYYMREEYEKALDYIQKAVDTGEASAEVLEHLGDVYHATGENDKAEEWWEKALDKDPDRTYLQDKIDQN